ncbi:hypothetical protein FRC01_000216 [Tulasnella sp. 417]|nr:hypothetical protein FRC01_000216 [Tulasnella sp. 417]
MLNIYAPLIAKHLNAFIPDLDLTATDIHALMALCGFDTAFQNGQASPWCGIFDKAEWANNEYYWDLEKYYGGSYGSPYAKAQGSGWVNELIARLTGKPVPVTGAINSTLDSDPTTFPLPPNSPRIEAALRGGPKSKDRGVYVRMILNQGVVPLDSKECGRIGVELGMCGLENFVKSQSFSQNAEDWDKVCSLPNPVSPFPLPSPPD